MRTNLIIQNACTLPHTLPTTHAILLSTSADATSAVLLKNPIASNVVYLCTELVHFPPESLPFIPFEAEFPEVRSPSDGKPANGTRTRFTYVETVSFLFGLVKFSFPLNGWFAVPDAGTVGENVGYIEILSNPETGRWRQALVRKVRCLREEEGGQTVVEEKLMCNLMWGTRWFSRGIAAAAHKGFMESLGDLFTENKS